MHLLNEACDSKFVARKLNFDNDQSNANCDAGNEIIDSTEVLKSNICDYNDAFILIRGDIITSAHNNTTQVAFKNCVPLTKCITKIDGTTIDNGEDLDLAMPMYNLIEHNSNFSDTAGSLWFYSKDEATNFNANIADNDNFKSFSYRGRLLQSTLADRNNSILKNATNY